MDAICALTVSFLFFCFLQLASFRFFNQQPLNSSTGTSAASYKVPFDHSGGTRGKTKGLAVRFRLAPHGVLVQRWRLRG